MMEILQLIKDIAQRFVSRLRSANVIPEGSSFEAMSFKFTQPLFGSHSSSALKTLTNTLSQQTKVSVDEVTRNQAIQKVRDVVCLYALSETFKYLLTGGFTVASDYFSINYAKYSKTLIGIPHITLPYKT